jgi:DNA-binding GntR family transcriptional regulator
VVTVDRRSLPDQIAELLMERVVSGHYQPGDRIVELQLARELGVSQTSVREALRQLQAVGLVEAHAHRGVTVSEVAPADLDVLVPVRAALEGTAARLAARKLDGNVRALEAELDAMRRSAADGNADEHYRHSFAFHALIAEASGNRYLRWLWDSLSFQTRIQYYANSRQQPPSDLRRNAEHHVPILDALASGDAEAAERLMYEHVLSYPDHIRRA